MDAKWAKFDISYDSYDAVYVEGSYLMFQDVQSLDLHDALLHFETKENGLDMIYDYKHS